MEDIERTNDRYGREQLLAKIDRLTNVILEKLETGSRENRLSVNEARLLGAVILRSIKLQNQILNSKKPPENVEELFAKLSDETVGRA